MQVGEIWAYRERVSDPACPLIPAEILQFGPTKTQKVRVRWQAGPYPGLDEWVTKRRLLVPWEESEAWLRDERSFALARDASRDADPVEHRAAWEVFYAYPRGDGILLEGIEATSGSTVEIADFDSVCRDLRLDPDSLLGEPLAFVDRHDTYIGTWAVARRLAAEVARTYTDMVLIHIFKEEKELQDKAVHGYTFRWTKNDPEYFVPSERCLEQLREMEPVFSLVREWCGAKAATRFDDAAALREEVVRLRELIEKTARRISDEGNPSFAQRVLRDMNRQSNPPAKL